MDLLEKFKTVGHLAEKIWASAPSNDENYIRAAAIVGITREVLGDDFDLLKTQDWELTD